MSHNPYPNANTSDFQYPNAAGILTNINQTNVGILPTTNSSTIESSSMVSITTTQSNLNNHTRLSINHLYGKLNDEHGGAGTRADDRKGANVKSDGYTATPVAQKVHP
ncbi:unnamed protein product [Rotaria sp. Silwood2]|nr:unnamed protein product [Rotaria sp. Silwood2]CAF2516794.1 unnamed protein product [Rotaria sp. Silwood2]CAF2752736.1 unnamed protein product [Rotaria sp. Silwood2]CAF2912003.1 unnamed protein product [Rotaria sp. Silwood2]CAF3884480.1 unnamed protein product [Rotaria sp. Silwood2]